MTKFTVSRSNGAKFYHTGEAQRDDYNHKTYRRKPPSHEHRKVIAWDMEGISLSGLDQPQHAVLFGCSANPSTPLLGQQLTTREMLEYIIDMGERNPFAIHVGYAFKYDANMIIAGLTEQQIVQLWKTNSVRFRFCPDYVWSIKWIPGKMFTVTKRWGSRRNTRAKVSVTIHDFSSFFGTTFIAAAEQILGNEFRGDDRTVIEHGKLARGHQGWEDIREITHYWSREIILIERVFRKFRDVMYRAGFGLREWYGPGALANYINATRKLRPLFAGAQTTSGVMPHEVHEASKIAFSGGRFELFQTGRITGPIYACDINSAYPYALTKIPSLSPDEGEWHHVSKEQLLSQSRMGQSGIALFGVYRLRFRAPTASPMEYRAMPLFWRDNRGLISYPAMAHGWYWSPEAALASRLPGVEIEEGWVWKSNEREFPWAFLQEMFDTRLRLGKSNLLSMPFKLGPNSLYGKYAQTVGWDSKKKLPPKSHALPVAGWTTSYCRALLYSAMLRAPGKIIAVETDAIYTTEDPSNLGISLGKQLGSWDADMYDEMIYVQSGFYHYKQDGKWKGVRSRGIGRSEYPYEVADSYLRSLKAGEEWPAMRLTDANSTDPNGYPVLKRRFIGAGAALAASEELKTIHTSWRAQTKEMSLGDTGKRTHVPKACPICLTGHGPNEHAHPLIIRSRSDGETLSHPRRLPWEQKHTPEVQDIRDQELLESELITR